MNRKKVFIQSVFSISPKSPKVMRKSNAKQTESKISSQSWHLLQKRKFESKYALALRKVE
jgi:hypothetical protein